MALNNRNGPKLFEVYLITCRVNGKKYVGKTVYSAKYRAFRHKLALESTMPLHRAIKAHGWDNFDLTVLYQGVDEKEISFVERGAIAAHNTYSPNGYNVTMGGDGRSGRVVSEETKVRMRAAQRGKIVSDKTRQKMSAARIGKRLSRETIEKMSASKRGRTTANKGRKPSPEVIARRVAGRSKTPSDKQLAQLARMHAGRNRANPVWCLETGEMWMHRKACWSSFGDKGGSTLLNAIDNPHATYKGLHFVSHVG